MPGCWRSCRGRRRTWSGFRRRPRSTGRCPLRHRACLPQRLPPALKRSAASAESPTTAAPGRATAPSPGGEGAGGRRPRPRSLSTAAGDSVDRRLRTSGTLMSATPTRRWTPPRLNLMTRSRQGPRGRRAAGDTRFGVNNGGEGRVQRHLGDHVASTGSDTASALSGLLWACAQHMAQVVACVVRLPARPPPTPLGTPPQLRRRHAPPGGPPTPRHAAKPRPLDAPTS